MRPAPAPVALALALAAATLCACASSGDGSRSTRATLPAGLNPFAAVELRIHPLTRVVPMDDDAGVSGGGPGGGGGSGGGSGSAQIEAHVELLDTYGHVVRDVGVLRFELYRGLPGVDPEAAPASATQELTWTLDLTDPARSARQFDRITYTYVVPLPGAPDWLFAGDPATLRVEFSTPDGRRIVATRRLRPS